MCSALSGDDLVGRKLVARPSAQRGRRSRENVHKLTTFALERRYTSTYLDYADQIGSLKAVLDNSLGLYYFRKFASGDASNAQDLLGFYLEVQSFQAGELLVPREGSLILAEPSKGAAAGLGAPGTPMVKLMRRRALRIFHKYVTLYPKDTARCAMTGLH